MYEVNDYIVAGNLGICKVAAIETPDFAPKGELYYVLQPIYGSNDTIYVSVEHNKLFMRKVMSKEEAEDYILKLPSIEPLWFENDKLIEAEYKEILKSNDCDKWIKMIKGLYIKRQEKLKNGKKLSQTDEKKFNKLEGLLMGEFALALQMPVEQTLDYIEHQLDDEVAQV